MDENFAFATLSAVLSTEFAVPAGIRIGPETRLAELDLDSVGLVELAVALEERFDVDLTGSGAAVITMDDRIGDLVRRLTGAHPAA